MPANVAIACIGVEWVRKHRPAKQNRPAEGRAIDISYLEGGRR
jgi:hypothetical protein